MSQTTDTMFARTTVGSWTDPSQGPRPMGNATYGDYNDFFFLRSQNGLWDFIVQQDGNLVVYNRTTNAPVWASNSRIPTGMNTNGRFYFNLYNKDTDGSMPNNQCGLSLNYLGNLPQGGQSFIWQKQGAAYANSVKLVLQNTGKLELRDGGNVLWST